MKKYHFDFLKWIFLGYIFGVFPVNFLITFQENAIAQIITRKTYEHGAFGNVTTYVKDYNIAYNSDDVRTEICYSPNSSQN